MNCGWQGAITAADLTCTITQSGYVASPSVRGVSITVFRKSELASMEVIQAVAVASSLQIPGPTSASPAPSGSASSTFGAAQSSGLGPASPGPTGVMMLVGGAAGFFAAALAL